MVIAEYIIKNTEKKYHSWSTSCMVGQKSRNTQAFVFYQPVHRSEFDSGACETSQQNLIRNIQIIWPYTVL